MGALPRSDRADGTSRSDAGPAPPGDHRAPAPDPEPTWTIAFEEAADLDRQTIDAHDSILTIGNGVLGLRGAREEDGEARQLALTAGVYDDRAENPKLLHGPISSTLVVAPLDGAVDRRMLDLRTGVLVRERSDGRHQMRTTRFVSLARPGTVAQRAVGATSVVGVGATLRLPAGAPRGTQGDAGRGRQWAQTRGMGGSGISAAAMTQVTVAGPIRTIDRIATYVADPHLTPGAEDALAALDEACELGFDDLLAEQVASMADLWRDADVAIIGDDGLTLALRHAVFHLLTSVASHGEAPVGPRGLSGDAYGGHVLWDADVFVLPALAAIRPAAARAMLEYRVRRTAAAEDLAKSRGRVGVLFPWESGRDGTDVTPHLVRRSGQTIPIRTGQHEEHINADIAWAAWHYATWTGDWSFLDGDGCTLVVETARYWASRIRLDDGGRGHIHGVVGPDEYHEIVDDDAYTNVMARWNLRRGADLLEASGGAEALEEAAGWRVLADAIVDGLDPATGRYEQCAGFWSLEPLVVSEHLEVPVMADEALGRRRVQQSQVIKQPAVLMLHHLVPDEVEPGSLDANLDFYGPRTAHGSSLSLPVHASLLARAGRLDEAVELFRMAARLDLDDSTGTTAHGLHTATAGGVWHALVWGFAGIRPRGDRLDLDPHLPGCWDAITATVRFRGARLRFTIDHEQIAVEADGPAVLRLADGTELAVGPPGTTFVNPAARP